MTLIRKPAARIIPLLLLFASHPAPAEVVINEIMYHPSSEATDEEFIELHNTGAAAVDVSGWQFTSGIFLTIPAATSIPAGGFLVVAADGPTFAAKFPAVTPVVAGWTGILSNSSNRITLKDALGTTIDDVKYTDDGDWATRQKDVVLDNNHRGWGWDSAADGLGSSLELINPALDNSSGQNWTASSTTEGTPGAANPAASADIAPLILDAAHFPLVPASSDPVHVTARLLDDHGSITSATVHYRIDADPSFTALPLSDDGAHGDTLAGDGIFGATLPLHANGTIIEFYLSASDNTGHSRTWPAPALDQDGVPGQTANCLYQVDGTPYAGATPIYRIIMRAVDRAELTAINASNTEDNMSHALMNGTFISRSGTGAELRHRVGVRNRGNGSRSAQPQSFRVNFLEQQDWEGVVGINLNTQNTPYQLLGSAAFRKAGLTAATSRAVQVRVNAVNPASSTGAPSYGFYVANEVIESNFADAHYPLDAGGNIYRGLQITYDNTSHGADLGDLSDNPDPALANPDPYRVNYFKRTNASEDDWSDLIRLTQKLAKGHSPTLDNPTWDPDYAEAVGQVADVTQWMRFFAANSIADNTETNLSNGRGDDYFMYIGKIDPRAELTPYDLDSIFGRSSVSSPTHSLWLMCRNDLLAGSPPGPMNPFMKHPDFAPIYFAELTRMIDGTFAPENFDPLADEVLGGLVNAAVITSIKNFNAARTAWIRTQIPLAITVTTAPAPLHGYPHTTNSTTTLGGNANAITTRSVTVNGTPATWTAWTATWSAPNIPLLPGINRVMIKALDGNGTEIESLGYDVWYDDGSTQPVSGTLASSTTWTAAGGPYEISSTLTLASGATLTIEPGTTIYLGAGADLIVASGGQILAEGSAGAPIRFAPIPGGSAWGTLDIRGGAGTPESRIAYARIDGNGSPAIDVNAGDVVLDHLDFGNTSVQYLSLDGASFLVSHCNFPTGNGAFELVHGTIGVKAGGRGIIRDCYFGKTTGYSDVIDFTGGLRPAPILQVINNVFTGSDDDILDIDGTDAWVEGNIFLHVHKNGSPDSAAAVSGGSYGGNVSKITILGNLFYDVDSAITAKQGNFYTFINNTVLRQTITGGTDTEGGVLNLGDEGVAVGAGVHVSANILADCEDLTRFYNPAESTLTFNQNLLPFPWTGPGSGNFTADPLFVHSPTLAETNFTDWQSAQIMRDWLALHPGSQARGSGPGGRDMGGVIPLGVYISGAPSGTTNLDSATLTVGPLLTTGVPWASGFTHYVWQLDGGGWSTEGIPTSTPLSLTGLAPGDHYVEVSGKNDAATWQDDPELGLSATITRSATWTVDPGYTPPAPAPLLRINEVLARNTDTLSYGSTFPDLIEIHNAGTASADLTGWGLSDNDDLPYKFIFPPGSTLAAGAYLLVHASSDAAVPAPKTGFGLKAEGDTLTLTRSPADGGGVADSIPFGAQLADYSIGRRATDGAWDLCLPTFGAANLVAARSPASVLRINEWLASPGALFATDLIELHNPSTLPVDIGLGYLTDNPVEWPNRHQLRQLTFIAAGGFALFKADGDPQQGPDHLAFGLFSSQGEIGLFDPSLSLIDWILYGPQTTGVSQGRSPNGGITITSFPQPTPGGPNPSSGPGTIVNLVNLIPVGATWSYQSSATHYDGFEAIAYNDTGWPSGGQLLYIEPDALTSPSGFAKTKALPVDGSNSNRPFQTTYFRRHFNFSGPLTDVTLYATAMIDDGAVFYLNGQEIGRLQMPAGPISYDTKANSPAVGEASERSLTLPAATLVVGDNVIAVEVHQYASGSAQTSTDVVFGLKLDAEITSSITSEVVINEVLAINATLTNPDSSLTGWIELHNPSDSSINISDMSLSDDFAQSRRWVFPPGTTIASGSSLVVHCDPLSPPSATNTALSLNPDGDSVLLFDPPAVGGGLRDSVSFGHQLPDLSIGRVPNATGAFTLNVPTRGSLNQAAALDPVTSLHIHLNEWLASASNLGDDWFEIFNSGSQPVLLGGHYLTDDLANKTKHPVLPLTFVGASGATRWLRFIADSNASNAGHVNFSLKASGEFLGIFTAAGARVDEIGFSAQTTDVSEGSFPDGSAAIFDMPPTPGTTNTLFADDSDGDGMPNTWEDANGLNSAINDAALDPDGDGQSNLAEFIAGTDPQDPASRLAASPDLDPSGRPLLRFSAVAGHSYSIFWSATLDGTWTKLTDIAPQANDSIIEVTDSDPAAKPRRFYRLVTPAQP